MKRIRSRFIGSAWSYCWSFISTKLGGAEYVKVSDNKVAKTKKLREGLLLDIDKNGNAVGIEILSGPPKILKTTKK